MQRKVLVSMLFLVIIINGFFLLTFILNEKEEIKKPKNKPKMEVKNKPPIEKPPIEKPTEKPPSEKPTNTIHDEIHPSLLSTTPIQTSGPIETKETECRNSNIQRNFNSEPISMIIPEHQVYGNGFPMAFWVIGSQERTKELDTCDTRCIINRYEKKHENSTDGYVTFHHFPLNHETKCPHQKKMHYTMENTHPTGFDIYFATRTDADIYASYGIYDFSVPSIPKKREEDGVSMAAAYISNCGMTRYDRLGAVKRLMAAGVSVDVFGSCFENSKKEPPELNHLSRDDRKVKNIKKYHFQLAFENSLKNGYLTEKYWQSLFVGTVPVVIGSPDHLHHFEPTNNSVLHWKNVSNVEEIASQLKDIYKDKKRYDSMLDWKVNGPSKQFLSVIDQFTCVNNYCTWCYKLGDTFIPETLFFKKDGFYVFVRELGKFRYTPVKLTQFTLEGLKSAILFHFKNYFPKWWHCPTRKWRKHLIGKVDPPPLNIYRIVPASLKFYESFFGDSIDLDEKVKKLKSGDKLEVIFL
jgi:hypothetical protein